MKCKLWNTAESPRSHLHVDIRLTVPEWCCLPMVVVVGKTRQSRKATLISFLLALFPLPFFLPSPVLFEQLHFAIHFLGCFSVQKESWAWLTDNSLYLVNNSTSSFYIFLAFLKDERMRICPSSSSVSTPAVMTRCSLSKHEK